MLYRIVGYVLCLYIPGSFAAACLIYAVFFNGTL